MSHLPVLPTVNAVLNATSAVLLLVGYRFIRRGQREAHKRTMLAALTCSALFLACYLYYHAKVGHVVFYAPGPWRAIYLMILASHTLLAIIIVPLILMLLSHALRGRFAQHKRIAKFTFPLWVYVSVTGVIVYLMLYVIFA